MKRMCRALLGCGLLWVLCACSSLPYQATSDTRLDGFVTREPDATRQRALRRLQLASLYFEQGQYEVAKQEVRAAIDIDDSYAPAYNLLGLIHQQQRAPQWAQQSFERAMKSAQSPQEWGAVQHNHGWFLCEQGQYAQGQAQLQRALAQPGYPDSVKTWLVLGDCQQRAGLRQEAQHSWRQALALEPLNPWLQQRLTQPEM